ncbi:VIT1/CCC1 transporter family protein [Patescibacteria group bacterium]|nr:VIT1/CCC1 transporter family protein [Patescibacteria group bacterium]
MHDRYNPDYIHHQNSKIILAIREIVFGMEDGMVSTLGAITGIAVGSQDKFTVVLAGMVIIAVESISMGIGSYISSGSERDVIKRKLYEEKSEIEDFPHEEKKELKDIYIRDGWPIDIADKMSEVASKNKKLMLKEMAAHELNISILDKSHPWRNGLFMFFAYIIGGIIPLFAYFLLPIDKAIYISIGATLAGLFVLGVATTKYTKINWLKAGFRIMILGGVALLVGYLVGHFADLLIK